MRKSKETKWTTTLRTAYPYDLDNKVSDDIKSTNNRIVGEVFLP